MTFLGRLCAVALAVSLAPVASAGRIDLVLDVAYAGGVPSAGGTWRLLASSDELGMFSLSAPIAGVNAGIVNELPRGRVNSSLSPNAGFSIFNAAPSGPSAFTVFAAQSVTPSGGGEQGVFYGVGTLNRGAPNYSGRPSGTTALGPAISTLTNLQKSPWGSQLASNPTAVTVASGSFSAGATPRFGPTDQLDGFLFTGLGTSQQFGPTEQAELFSTLVRTNLSFGVATGDYNADGVVNAADYTRWRDTFGQSVTALTGADGDGDGLIDEGDYAVWQTNYGASSPGTAVATPEPTTLLLLAAPAIAACFSANRREKTEQKRGVA